VEELPKENTVFDRLAPIFPMIYEAFEHGATVARVLFDEWGIVPEPHAFASITRLHAIRVLDRRGRELDGYMRTHLTNSGVQLTFAGYDLRFWKTSDGELPNATSSNAKLRFFRQLPLGLFKRDENEAESPSGRNLVIQWEYSSFSGNIGLTVVCPKPGDVGVESVEAYWSRPIPHPAETIAPVSISPVEDATDDDLTHIQPLTAEVESESSG